MSGWDKDQITRMTRDQLRDAMYQNSLAREKIRLRAENTFARGLEDRELVEALRLAAWAKESGRVTAQATPHGAIPVTISAPEGWPEGTSPEQALRERLGEEGKLWWEG